MLRQYDKKTTILISVIGVLVICLITLSAYIIWFTNGKKISTETKLSENSSDTNKEDLSISPTSKVSAMDIPKAKEITPTKANDANNTIDERSTKININETPLSTQTNDWNKQYSDDLISFEYNQAAGWKIDVKGGIQYPPEYIIYLDEKDNVYGSSFDGTGKGTILQIWYKNTLNSCIVTIHDFSITLENKDVTYTEKTETPYNKNTCTAELEATETTLASKVFAIEAVTRFPNNSSGVYHNLQGRLSYGNNTTKEQADSLYNQVLQSMIFK